MARWVGPPPEEKAEEKAEAKAEEKVEQADAAAEYEAAVDDKEPDAPHWLKPGTAIGGAKTIGAFGSVALLVNNITGPAMDVIPAVYAQSGFLPTTALIVGCGVMVGFACEFLAKASAAQIHCYNATRIRKKKWWFGAGWVDCSTGGTALLGVPRRGRHGAIRVSQFLGDHHFRNPILVVAPHPVAAPDGPPRARAPSRLTPAPPRRCR